jgi:hypothetical protein
VATTLTSSIGTASRDYSTIAGWEAATDYNLVTADVIEVGECYNDSTFELSAAISIMGSTNDADHYRHLTAAAGHRHMGDPTAGVLVTLMTSNPNRLITVSDGPARVSWLRVKLETTQTSEINTVNLAGGARAYAVIVTSVHAAATTGTGNVIGFGGASAGQLRIEACAVGPLTHASSSTRQRMAFFLGSPMEVYNCSAHTAGANYTGFYIFDNAYAKVLRNCYAGGTGTGFARDGNAFGNVTYSNNASSDGTADDFGGTGHLVNLTHANQVQDSANADLRLKAGADLIDAGADLSAVALYTDGFNGHTRLFGWDIGADEYPVQVFDVRVTATAYSDPEDDPGERIWRVYFDGAGTPFQSTAWITPATTHDFELPEGDYEFTVQDRDIYGAESGESTRYPFTVTGTGDLTPGSATHAHTLAAVAIAEDLPAPAAIVSTTDATNPIHGGVRDPAQKSSFYANGRYWVFYADQSKLKCRTSVDGAAWSNAVEVRASMPDNSLRHASVFFDGTFFHYAVGSLTAGNNNLWYRRGTPNSNGTITWSAAEQTIDTSLTGHSNRLHGELGITVGSDGHAYVSYEMLNDHATLFSLPVVVRNANTDGTWTTATGHPLILSEIPVQWWTALVPLSAGKAYVIYYTDSFTGGARLKGRIWGGSAWGSEEDDLEDSANMSSDTSNIALASDHATDRVFLTYMDVSGGGNGVIKFRVRSSGGTWGTPQTVFTRAAAWSGGTMLTTDPSNDEVYAFHRPTTTKIVYRKRDAVGDWDTGDTELVDVSSYAGTITGERIQSSQEDYGGQVIVTYQVTRAAPAQHTILFHAIETAAPPVGDLETANVSHDHTVDAAAVEQNHELATAGTSHAHTLAAVALAVAVNLTPASLSHTQTVGAVEISQVVTYNLTPDALTHTQTLAAVALTQAHGLTTDGLSHAQTLGAAAVTQAHALQPDWLFHAQTLDAVAVLQAHGITVDPLAHGQTVDSSALEAAVALTLDNVAHAQSVEPAATTQAHGLTVGSASHAHTLDPSALDTTTALSTDVLAHAQTVASATTTQAYGLTMDDASHAQTVDAVEVDATVEVAYEFTLDDLPGGMWEGTRFSYEIEEDESSTRVGWAALEIVEVFEAGDLNLNNLSHTQSLQPVSVVQDYALSPVTSSHAHTLAAVALSVVTTLAPASLTHAQIVEPSAVSQAVSLTVDNLSHAQTIESAALTQAVALSTDSLSHSHTLSAVELLQAHGITVDGLSHTQQLDPSSLDVDISVSPATLSHAQLLEPSALTQAHEIVTVGATHSQALDPSSVEQTHVLSTDEATHSQSLGTVAISLEAVLETSALSHAQTIDTLSVAQTVPLDVDSVTHDQILDPSDINQTVSLDLDSLLHASTVDLVELVQSHSVITDDLAHAQQVDSSALEAEATIVPASLSHTQSLDPSAISQEHSLDSDQIAHDQFVYPADLTQDYTLGVDAATHEQSLSESSLQATAALGADTLTHSQTIDESAISQDHAVDVSGLSHAQSLEFVAVTQAHGLTIEGVAHAQTLDPSAIDAAAALTVDGLTHAQSLESTATTQAHGLTIEGVAHAQTLDSVVVLQAHGITVDPLAHGHTLDESAIDADATLTTDDLAHAQTVDAAAIIQAYGLLTDDATHTQTVEAVEVDATIKEPYEFTLDDLPSGMWEGTRISYEIEEDESGRIRVGWSALEIVEVFEAGHLNVNGLSHAQSIAGSTLDQAHGFTTDDASHAQTLEPSALSVDAGLIPDELTHSQALDTLAVTQAHEVATETATHAQSLDPAVVTQAHEIQPDPADHAQTIQPSSLTAAGDLASSNLSHTQSIDSAAINQAAQLDLDELSQSQSVDTVELSQVYEFAIDSLSHGQELDAAEFSTASLLLPETLSHTQ